MLNPTAGETGRSPEQIEGWLRIHDHRVRVVTTDDDRWERTWSDADDTLVVAAGGDGTVQKVARAVAGTSVPFTILPLGTANNIARALGLDPDDLDGIAASWSTGSLVASAFDVPLLSTEQHGGRFVEAVGGPLIADVAHHGETVTDVRSGAGRRARRGEATGTRSLPGAPRSGRPRGP